MRRTLLAILLAALVLGVGPTLSLAEDEPPGDAEEPEAPKGDWDADAFWFTKLIAPSEVMAAVSKKLQAVPGAERRLAQAKLLREYLDVRDEHGPALGSLDPKDLQALSRIHVMLYDYRKALVALEAVFAREGIEAEARDAAIGGVASLLGNSRTHEALGEEVLAGLAATLTAYLEERTGDDAGTVRGGIHAALARYASAQEDEEGAIRHNMLSAIEDPSRAAGVGRTLVRTLQSSTHDMQGYATLRSTMAAVLPMLKQLAAHHFESIKESGDARAVSVAERGVAMLESVDRPIAMLGQPAQEWTLERAYGDVTSLADVKGKVVVLDFWATWCPWCIKSFPAIRDLLEAYSREDLAIVGVTASASSVYEQRWDLDDDLKEKADGQRPQPVARLARGTAQPDPEKRVFAETEYREVEQKALETFVRNHEMTWPVVLIDKEEPGPKFAVGGWPHAVVLDRHGRVRYFKVGALLTDRPEAVAAFRAVLDDLIAEDATTMEPADDSK